MITEEYLRKSHVFRRLKSGPQGQIVELYAARLVKHELAGASSRRRLKLVADLFSWIKKCGLKLTDLDEHMTERYLKYRAGKRSIQSSGQPAVKRLLSVLRDAGMIPPAPTTPSTPEDQIFAAFSDYLRQERGLAPVCSRSLRRCKMADYAGWKRDDDRWTDGKSRRIRCLSETIRHSPPVGI